MMGRNSYFAFKQFTVQQEGCAMKVTTDACLFGAWCAQEIKTTSTETILDIGIGTGLLSLMIAQQTSARITAVEVDALAAAQAARNFNNSPFADRLTIDHTDVRALTKINKYDAIISNPPFYEQQLKSPLQGRNNAMHSAMLTLQELLTCIDGLLQPQGQLFLLMPYYRKQELLDTLPAFNLYASKVVSVAPVAGKPFFRLMIAAGREMVDPAEESLVIKEADRAYTPEFSQLLQPYYLFL